MRRLIWILGSTLGIATLLLTLGSAVAPASSLNLVSDDEAAKLVGGQTGCGWEVIVIDNNGCGAPSKTLLGVPYEWCPVAVHRSPNGVPGSLCVLSRYCYNCGNNCNMHDDTQFLCYPQP